MSDLNLTNALRMAQTGAELAHLGHHDEAVAAYRSALDLKPDMVEAHANLSVSLASLGDIPHAIRALRHAIALRPDIPDLQDNLARLSLRNGDQGTALSATLHSLNLSPGSSDALLGLGNEYLRQDRRREALAYFRAAAIFMPQDYRGYLNMVSLLTDRLERDRSVAGARAAVRLRPDLSTTHHGLSSSLERRGDVDDAAAAAKWGLVIEPDFAECWAHFSTIQMVLGQFDAARTAIIRALTLLPSQPRYYRALGALTSSWSDTDPHLAAMKKLFTSIEGYDKRDQAELHYALAKVFEDRGDANDRFDHLRKANTLMRATVTYDEKAALAMFDALQRTVTRDYLASRQGAGPTSDRPIFIVGMPRSGTSLAEQILASHSRAFGIGESPLFSQLLHHRLRRRVQVLGDAFTELTHADFGEMGEAYLARTKTQASAAQHIVDKMPANFTYAGLIHLAMPGARIIHMRRNPVDNCLSCFATLFADGQEYSYDLTELGRYYRAYTALMDHWRLILPPDRFLEVQYEDLVEDFESQVQRMLTFCGLEWEDGCLAFHRTKRPVRTASATQVRRPLYKSSIGKLRPDEERLAPLLDALRG